MDAWQGQRYCHCGHDPAGIVDHCGLLPDKPRAAGTVGQTGTADASSEDTQDADTREDTGSTAKPDDADSTPDQQDGQTESEEDVGRNTQDQDSSDTETTREDTKDSGMTTTEEDVGAGSEACRTE